MESLSDHRYIMMELSGASTEERRRRQIARETFKRWSIRKLNQDAFKVVITNATWPSEEDQTFLNIEEEVKWMGSVMTTACDQSMPKVKPGRRRAAVWWSEGIADLRRKSIQVNNRIYHRRKRTRIVTQSEIDSAWEDSKAAKHELAAAILKAKANAWEDLINDLNRDP